jgi:hypothetical protein
MGLIELVVTVCAIAQADACREEHMRFVEGGSPAQCAMMAPPYIAQWVGEHPKWRAVRWHCDVPSRRRAA